MRRAEDDSCHRGCRYEKFEIYRMTQHDPKILKQEQEDIAELDALLAEQAELDRAEMIRRVFRFR